MKEERKKKNTPVRRGGQGPFLERLIFKYRPMVLVLFSLLTIFLTYQALQLRADAGFLKMIPRHHPYVENFLKHYEDMKGLGNVVQIAVETTGKDIFSAGYMSELQKITDEVFYIPGIDRGTLKSLWTPQTRWTDVTEEGFEGGAVVPDTYDGSAAALAQLRVNVLKSGELGILVANNYKSSIVKAPLQDIDPDTGKRLDYRKLSERLETIRTKYQSDTLRIHITGFAKIAGDLIEGVKQVSMFFGITIVIMLAMSIPYFRFPRSALIILLCSVVGVVWQLGMLHVLGYGLDPYSLLVPFLIFALGISHGSQIVNAIQHEMMSNGTDRLEASRLAFRSLYIPGLTAIVTDAVGFATLLVIRIEVIQELGIGACLGAAMLILIDLVLLPVIMSYTGISKRAVASLRQREEGKRHPVWSFIARFTTLRYAVIMFFCIVPLYAWGLYAGRNATIGDLEKGAPELQADSRYNRDLAFMVENYLSGSDVFVVILETPDGGNSDYNTLVAVDQLHALLKKTEGVQSVTSMLDVAKLLNGAFNEGNVKWMALSRSQVTLDGLVDKVPSALCNKRGSFTPIMAFLKDHKAETLERVVMTVQRFSEENNTDKGRFLMAAGNAGIEAATNIVIKKAEYEMLAWVYGIVILMCLLTFQSIRATLCIILPLGLTSVLCKVLMDWLGIGVKVATLPVIAVGVGIGVDYGVYIYSKLKSVLTAGCTLPEACYQALKTTGSTVAFTGVTLACGVCTWIFSPIKFQADMGILLTFMFVVNMMGAIFILPALYRITLCFSRGKAPAESPSMCFSTANDELN